ncbi:MAG: hypothetical protein AAF938_21900 [Myxococcota bacterium]
MTGLLKTSAVLWVIWGLVHVFAGVMTLSQPIPGAIGGIADAVDPATLAMDYPAAVGGILNQHGFNLAWFGLVTIVAGVYIWRGSSLAIFIAALVGGLADVGYFLFIDLAGFANFVPGTVMTIVSGSAIALSFYAHFRGKPEAS